MSKDHTLKAEAENEAGLISYYVKVNIGDNSNSENYLAYSQPDMIQ